MIKVFSILLKTSSLEDNVTRMMIFEKRSSLAKQYFCESRHNRVFECVPVDGL